ncbi:hypothetical protein H8356DRAFT_1735056 [Neocallimastix lanati (nom. inval.)]|jgi:hypothetical protein|uniref:Uncharacterized protein n=1 Tax=Neocallimastix californiae TaxID=1754190 RepID=A0A1Y1Z9G8_9FUNG|nr:hypothetical protein H8356DRAFT_1735056 [Neocallimastix sp. JGI-2020a]ORY06922.1 hypothetical protein LY90DRAFT_709163 [Neocallimastix californiae]|eukprot:ORY06922.1 hypothetical protein LY90DRAFT_709163 [Neocallimastix californiae]
MRPDPYKQKKSRRYQLTHKNKITNKDNKNDNKDSIAINKEKNNSKELNNNNNDNDNKNNKGSLFNKKSNKKFDEENSKSYGRRKIFDNSYRYEEPTYEEQLEAEAEIDVEVEDALLLINSQENTIYDPSSYFKFKKENWINNEEFAENDNKMEEIFYLDFNKLDNSFKRISIWDKIKIKKDFIIENDDNGYVNESKNVNKIIPTYNYIHKQSINLNNKFNFNIPAEVDYSKVVPNNTNNPATEANNNIFKKKENEIDKKIISNPSNDIDFEIDELLNNSKPRKTQITKETAIEDELDMLLSLETNKLNNDSNIKNNINNVTISNNNSSNNNNNNNSNISNNGNNSTNNNNIDNLQDWLDDLLS